MSERPHVTSMLEGYVIGALSDADVARVEAHVIGCSACAARLAREAELDVAFEAVVSSQRTHARSGAVRVSSSMALGAALAMAAGMLLWLVPRGADDTHAPSTVQETPSAEVNADASTFTASLDLQVDGSRVGVKD
jgi:anti-sigma factor RsiW